MSGLTPTSEQVIDVFALGAETAAGGLENLDIVETTAMFDRWIADVKAKAWEEGYRLGVDDARTADALQVGIGLGAGCFAQPARANPYRKEAGR